MTEAELIEALRPFAKRFFDAGFAKGRATAVRTFAAPGPPPRPGLTWKEETHRWVNPHTGEEHPHEPAPKPNGVPVKTPADTPKNAAHPIVGTIQANLESSQSLSAEQKAHYRAAMSSVLSAMPKAALDRMSANLNGVSFHPSTKDIPNAIIEQLASHPSLTTDAERDEIRQKYAYLREKNIGGVYVNGFASIHGDGDLQTTYQQPGRHEQLSAARGVYAHELTHAIDGPGYQISKSPEWQDAFKSEIDFENDTTPPITYYAGQKPSEGLAEFGRLVYASDVPHAQIAKEFPKAAAVFKAHGLWPTEERKGAAAKMPEAFSERLPIGTDGTHAGVLKAPAGWGTLSAGTANFAAPGPPPHPGLEWKEATHRWVNPHTGEEHEHPTTAPQESAKPNAVGRVKQAIIDQLSQTKDGRVVLAMGKGATWLYHQLHDRLFFAMNKDAGGRRRSGPPARPARRQVALAQESTLTGPTSLAATAPRRRA